MANHWNATFRGLLTERQARIIAMLCDGETKSAIQQAHGLSAYDLSEELKRIGSKFPVPSQARAWPACRDRIERNIAIARERDAKMWQVQQDAANQFDKFE